MLQLRGQQIESVGLGQPEDFPLVILPANTLPLAPLPEARRHTAATNIRQVIEQALAEEADEKEMNIDEGKELRQRAANSAKQDPEWTTENGSAGLTILGNACATCQGRCCQNGGAHAYLSVATIRSYRASHPGKSAEETLTDYLSCIPGVSYENSCIYHGPCGCALPCGMRSDACLSFYCGELDAFRRQITQQGPRQGFAVAMEEGQVVRIAVIDGDAARPISSK